MREILGCFMPPTIDQLSRISPVVFSDQRSPVSNSYQGDVALAMFYDALRIGESNVIVLMPREFISIESDEQETRFMVIDLKSQQQREFLIDKARELEKMMDDDKTNICNFLDNLWRDPR